jgi:hypothetical protein
MGKKNLNPADAYRKYFFKVISEIIARTYNNTEGKAQRKKELKKAFTFIKFFITRSDHGSAVEQD